MVPALVAGFVLGFVLLVAGGESLVRGAGSLARTQGMSSLAVGLTVVSFTTSALELAASADAAFSGHPGLAVGNIVGSNVFKIGAVLGVTAIVAPQGIAIHPGALRFDLPVFAGGRTRTYPWGLILIRHSLTPGQSDAHIL